jgi:hypothetical protein
MRKTWLLLLTLVAAAAVAIYGYNFGPGNAWELSRHTEDWARFGQYIGGVFGTLAFIAVLGVINNQRRLIDRLRSATTLEELLREARHLATTIETMLASPVLTVAIIAQQLSSLDKPATVAGVLELADPRVASEVGRPMPPPAEAKGAYRKAIVTSIAGLSQKLDLLAAVLSEYVSRGGDSIFLLFYRDRLRPTVQRLVSLEVAVSTADWWLASSEESESRRWRF